MNYPLHRYYPVTPYLKKISKVTEFKEKFSTKPKRRKAERIFTWLKENIEDY